MYCIYASVDPCVNHPYRILIGIYASPMCRVVLLPLQAGVGLPIKSLIYYLSAFRTLVQVMELCSGGELYDRWYDRGTRHWSGMAWVEPLFC